MLRTNPSGSMMMPLDERDERNRRLQNLEREVQALRDQADGLADQLEFFQILIDSIPTPIFFENLDNRITLCNMAFETVVQTIREDVVNRRLKDIVSDPNLAELLKSPEVSPEVALQPHSVEGEVTFADGSVRHVEVRHVLYFNLKGEPAGTVGMIIDLTDQKRAEAAEIEADRLRTAQKLAISIAHEFNNPLMIISGVYQLLKPTMKEALDEPMQDHMERIPRAVSRMHDLVKKLMKLNTLKEAEYAAGQTFFDLNASSEKEDDDVEPEQDRDTRDE